MRALAARTCGSSECRISSKGLQQHWLGRSVRRLLGLAQGGQIVEERAELLQGLGDDGHQQGFFGAAGKRHAPAQLVEEAG